MATRANEDHANDGGSRNNATGSGGPGGGDTDIGFADGGGADDAASPVASKTTFVAERGAASNIGADDGGVEMMPRTTTM